VAGSGVNLLLITPEKAIKLVGNDFFRHHLQKPEWVFVVFTSNWIEWWAYLRSNLSAKSQIFTQKDLNLYDKAEIKSQITSPNHRSF